jgi:acetoin utilization deacetylase AcuC-like enzyme
MPNRTGYVYDDVYLEHELGPFHPESPLRLAALHAVIAGSGLLQELVGITPLTDEKKIIEHAAAIHTQEHIGDVRACRKTGIAALRAAGGVMAAVDAVCSGTVENAFCAVRPPGHHAHNNAHNDGPCQGEGFCFLNNIAIASRYAQRAHGLKNILIVDWDYHHGNGTEDAFYDDPTVFYFSTHRLNAYPGTGYPHRTGDGPGKGYNLNVPLPSPGRPHGRVVDEDLAAAWNNHLLPGLTAVDFRPDLVCISAGFDSRMNDSLGDFSITDDGFRRITGLVMKLATGSCGGTIVSALEGGYAPEGLAAAGYAHVKTLAETAC